MKQVYFLFSICLFLFACNTTQTTTKDHYLPDVLQSVQLGMPMEQVLKLRPKAYVVNSVQNTPRQVYTEDIENDNYQAIDYFFDKTGEKSLVELNIRHTSEEKAEQTIRKHFGESKNHKQKQEHFEGRSRSKRGQILGRIEPIKSKRLAYPRCVATVAT